MEEVDRSDTDHLGNKFAITTSKLYPGLLTIVCVNKQINIPKELDGHFTGKDQAMRALHKYLSTSWSFSDDQVRKNQYRQEAKYPDYS
jgi:hypothetical protein